MAGVLVNRFRRLLAIAGVAGFGLIACAPGASAAMTHPLGNFTVNTYTGLRVEIDRLVIDRVVDSAEIPTVQAQRSIDTDGNGAESAAERAAYRDRQCARLVATTSVKVGTTTRRLAITRATLGFPAGSAGLDTMRLECTLETPVTIDEPQRLVVTTSDAVGEIGWHEMTAVGDGVTLDHSPLPTTSLSDRLHGYPANRIQSPPDVTRGSVLVRAGGPQLSDGANPGRPISASSLSAVPGIDRASSSFTDLISTRDLTLWAASLAVVVAIFLGSLHALAPGHGKTVMAAYLVGQRGTTRQALGLCAAVTVTHTAGVLTLGTILTVTTVIAPERLYPILGAASGLLVASIGVGLLTRAVRARRRMVLIDHEAHHHSEHEHEHEHERVLAHVGGGHEHDHPHGHDHPHDAHPHDAHQHGPGGHSHGEIELGMGWRSMVALGFAGGMVPSPSALVVLLGAIALGRTWFGVILVLGYGVGMALSLVAAGLLLVRIRGRLDRYLVTSRGVRMSRWMAIAPAVTAVFVIGGGVWIAARALVNA